MITHPNQANKQEGRQHASLPACACACACACIRHITARRRCGSSMFRLAALRQRQPAGIDRSILRSIRRCNNATVRPCGRQSQANRVSGIPMLCLKLPAAEGCNPTEPAVSLRAPVNHVHCAELECTLARTQIPRQAHTHMRPCIYASSQRMRFSGHRAPVRIGSADPHGIGRCCRWTRFRRRMLNPSSAAGGCLPRAVRHLGSLLVEVESNGRAEQGAEHCVGVGAAPLFVFSWLLGAVLPLS